MTHLKNNVDKYYQERICQIEQKPHLHWLHYCCAGEGGRHREIDGGQHHHAGDVHRDNQVILGVSIDVVGELVDDVDKDGWQVCYHENTNKFIFNMYAERGHSK